MTFESGKKSTKFLYTKTSYDFKKNVSFTSTTSNKNDKQKFFKWANIILCSHPVLFFQKKISGGEKKNKTDVVKV